MNSDIGIPTSAVGQWDVSLKQCATCNLEIWPAGSLRGYGNYKQYCSCVRVQVPKEQTSHHPAAIRVDTRFNAERIEQELVCTDQAGDPMHRISLQVIQLQDQGIREALIKMGWTPPPDQQ